jgi:hypothetical protein
MAKYLMVGKKNNIPFPVDLISNNGIKPESVKKIGAGSYGVTYYAEMLNGKKILIKQSIGA